MKKPVFFQNLLSPSVGIMMAALTLFSCEKDDSVPREISNIPVYPESYVIETSSWLDFSSNLQKTLEIDLPVGRDGGMEFYLVRHFAGERLTYKLPGHGADNQSFYTLSLDESPESNRMKIIIERRSGPGESYHGISTVVSVRPGDPIVEN